MNAISVRQLTVRFGNDAVLENVSVDIPKGKITAIIGGNGSGKSTFIKAILGLVPSTGTIKILGHAPNTQLRTIGYVPQHFDFDRTVPITVNEFLNFSRPRVGTNKAKEICREVQVDALHDKLLGELSGGQLQRVLIVNALFKNPSILLLDEPSAGIDIEGAKAFYDLVRHLNEKHGVTVVLISHEVSFVSRFADSVICLNRKLVCFGPPSTSLTHEKLEQLYGQDVTIHGHSHV